MSFINKSEESKESVENLKIEEEKVKSDKEMKEESRKREPV